MRKTRRLDCALVSGVAALTCDAIDAKSVQPASRRHTQVLTERVGAGAFRVERAAPAQRPRRGLHTPPPWRTRRRAS